MNLRKNLFQFLKAVFSGFAIAVPIFIALVVGYWRGHKDTLEHQETPSVFTQKVLSWFSDVEPEKMEWLENDDLMVLSVEEEAGPTIYLSLKSYHFPVVGWSLSENKIWVKGENEKYAYVTFDPKSHALIDMMLQKQTSEGAERFYDTGMKGHYEQKKLIIKGEGEEEERINYYAEQSTWNLDQDEADDEVDLSMPTEKSPPQE